MTTQSFFGYDGIEETKRYAEEEGWVIKAKPICPKCKPSHESHASTPDGYMLIPICPDTDGMKNYAAGLWSRRNLAAMIEDFYEKQIISSAPDRDTHDAEAERGS